MPDTQTYTKQSNHDDQILKIDPASTVHLTKKLNPPAKQITTHELRTRFYSYAQADLAPQVCLP